MKLKVSLVCDSAISKQSFDKNGFLSISRSNLTKANIREYYGYELKDYLPELDPDKLYRFYTPVEEIEKAAPTIKGKPLLLLHEWVLPENVPVDQVVGSVGSDVGVDGDYLYGDLYVHKQDGIDAIKNKTHKDISAGYDLKPILRAGTTPTGDLYDGIFTDIEFNHVALVPVGRTGEGVQVSDEKPKERGYFVKKINKSRLASNLKSACFGIFDHAVDFGSLAAAVVKDNVPAEKLEKGIIDSLDVQALADKKALLTDGRVLAAIMDAAEEKKEEGAKDEGGEEKPKTEVKDDDPDTAVQDEGKTLPDLLKFLKENMSPRDNKLVSDFLGGGAKDCSALSSQVKDSAPVMDKQIVAKIIDVAHKKALEDFKNVTIAREKVLKNGISVRAMDSAPNVYKEALTAMNVDFKGFDDAMLERVYDQEVLLRQRYSQNAAAGVVPGNGVSDGAPTGVYDARGNISQSMIDECLKEMGIVKNG